MISVDLIPRYLFSEESGVLTFMFSNAVELLLYSPNRPILDYSVIFLWLMAVGTIVTASLWAEFTGTEQCDERYNELSPKVTWTRQFFFMFLVQISTLSRHAIYKKNICCILNSVMKHVIGHYDGVLTNNISSQFVNIKKLSWMTIYHHWLWFYVSLLYMW